MLGGFLYAGLGASRCFAVSAALPSLSLALLALPTARRWWHGKTGAGLGGGGGDGQSYELVGKVSDERASEGLAATAIVQSKCRVLLRLYCAGRVHGRGWLFHFAWLEIGDEYRGRP